ncbi:MAG TPA: YciI family protein [Caulobacterales bacterium]|nr:YciI family protein [Caulobacterales bacterium]
MRYMILIHRTPTFWRDLPAQEQNDVRAAYMAYADAVRSAGVLVAADQLQGADTAKLVSRDGVADGPYAETREELGGYFLIDVPNEAEAIAWARKCPGAGYGRGVEVRPVVQR